jgi:SAM-dependent methyltransferase
LSSILDSEPMFTNSALLYDKIYSFKDYCAEAGRLRAIVRENLRVEGNRLLDVACGTGRHIEHLTAHFHAEGLDIDRQLLEIARERNPGLTFHQADMVDFDLGHRFDVVICLFSSIGYVETLENLGLAVGCMARHLVPGGLLVIEPWFTPDAWRPNMPHALFIDEPELKIARVNTSLANGRLSWFDFHYLIGTTEGTEHFVEHHKLGLFTTDEMRAAFIDAGLDVQYDAQGLTGRGLYVGMLPG